VQDVRAGLTHKLLAEKKNSVDLFVIVQTIKVEIKT